MERARRALLALRVLIATQAFRLSPADADDVFQEVFTRGNTVDKLRDEARSAPGSDSSRGGWLDPAASGRTQPDGQRARDRVRTLDRLEEAIASGGARELRSPAGILDRFFARDESYGRSALEIPSGTIASPISRCLGQLQGGGLEGKK